MPTGTISISTSVRAFVPFRVAYHNDLRGNRFRTMIPFSENHRQGRFQPTLNDKWDGIMTEVVVWNK